MLRRAGSADLDAIMAIEIPTFGGDAWSPATMGSDLASPYCFYLVDELDGAIVAYAGLRHIPGTSDADIQTIAVRADRRRAGTGRMLMEALIAQAVAEGAREVFLDVRADNESAQRLYLDLGFEQIGVRPDYYPEGPTDAIVMRLRTARPGTERA